jgi:hypothetical protein
MILIDNTVLSNFALIQHPEFIRLAFLEDVGTSTDVMAEYELRGNDTQGGCNMPDVEAWLKGLEEA